MPLDLIATVEIRISERAADGEWKKGRPPILDDLELVRDSDFKISKKIRQLTQPDPNSPRPDFREIEEDAAFRRLAAGAKNFLRIEYFLERHLDHLRDPNDDREVHHVRFMERDGSRAGKDRFEKLLRGEAQDFGTQTVELAKRMHEVSGRNVGNGVLVAIRRRFDDDTHQPDNREVAVLKLDLHDPAVRMVRRASHAHLESVRNALDFPDGPLPKAAVYPYVSHEGSDVLVVDNNKTLFFLKTIDAQLFLEDAAAAEQLRKFIKGALRASHRSDAAEVALRAERKIGKVPRDGIGAAELVDGMTGLTEKERTKIHKEIRSSPRTVSRITPGERTRVVRTTAGLTLQIPVSALNRSAHWLHDEEGWHVVLDTPARPW